ncbi:hypothetical protein AC579_3793 [Pseudocercospora musae]|uniref:Carbohydrate kinase PfkB domain-containing protein n=1 Tax=Pseudocercospora musae TaxID=113226 RepID=A0A139I1C0_9PEZI|nr:hypothetical protein AC579_3793 [Pseudocercospora musae]
MAGPIFIALGGVWLDEIRIAEDVKFKDVLGGSVTFATLGARLFKANSKDIRLIVCAGHDFPGHAVEILRSWKVDLSVHGREDTPHARGIAHYGNDDSAPISTGSTYLGMSEVINTKSFHFFETPETLTENVKAILYMRLTMQKQDPLVIWEPQAKTMTPDSLSLHCATTKLVDVFSPNHMELAKFFKGKLDGDHKFDRQIVEHQASHFLDNGIRLDGKGCIVVRCAEYGCLVSSQATGPRWLPAYHTDPEKVVNTTGAGNAFLGAFTIGVLETNDIVKAAMYGQVASSFVIEQVGVPKLSKASGDELWNGAKARDRLAEYEQRVSQISQDET